MGRALVLVVIVACGGRTGLRGDVTGDAGVSRDSAVISTAYEVVYEASVKGGGFDIWHSATGAVTGFPVGDHFERPMSCTYDGRFIAAQNAGDAWSTFDVIDSNGTVVRTQTGQLAALRPDGMRAIVSGIHDGCVGTLDADGTYADVACSSSDLEGWEPVAYAPDGETVLWMHLVYAPTTTDTDVTYETATEQLTNERVVLGPLAGTGLYSGSPSFSSDGTRLAFADCTKAYDEFFCKLETVRLDTLETTTVLDLGKPQSLRSPAFTPDGEGIVYMASEFPNEPNALRRLDLATGVETVLADPSHAPNDGPPQLCVAYEP